jgi:hypothetical protein
MAVRANNVGPGRSIGRLLVAHGSCAVPPDLARDAKEARENPVFRA